MGGSQAWTGTRVRSRTHEAAEMAVANAALTTPIQGKTA
jgi:hypothetical protein